jgi:hypothetical protein
VVEKIWNFEFQAIFVDFSETKHLSGIIFQISGPNCEISDCGLIFEKPRGFVTKLPGIIIFGIIFLRKKTCTRSTGRGPDYGLIFEKPKGFVAKLSGIIVFGIIFVWKRRGLGPRSVDHVQPRSSVDRGGAAESTAARLPESDAQELRLTGGCRKGRRRGRGTWRCRGCPHWRQGGGETVGRWWQSGSDEGTWWG